MDADCESRAQLTGQTGHEQDHDGDNMLKIHSAKITVIASKDSSIILYFRMRKSGTQRVNSTS